MKIDAPQEMVVRREGEEVPRISGFPALVGVPRAWDYGQDHRARCVYCF